MMIGLNTSTTSLNLFTLHQPTLWFLL